MIGCIAQQTPSPVTQPDGSVLQLLASGDEYDNRLHDAQGYTINFWAITGSAIGTSS
mgnify:CR=1 FL=1